MNTVSQPGVGPQYSVQDAGAKAAIGVTPKAAPAAAEPANAVQAGIDPKDQVNQSAGASGKAAPVDLVGSSTAVATQIRSLLARQDYDTLAKVVNQHGVRALGKLDLSLSEIKAIASGLGQDGTFSRFTQDERDAVQALLVASKISPSERLQGILGLLGPDAALSHLRTAPLAELKGLSQTERSQMLTLMGSDGGMIDSFKSAVNEVVMRRGMGISQQAADDLTSKLMRAAGSENERRQLLQQVSQFDRDDVTYRYVMNLSAKELAGLSDDFKQDLLKQLIDTGISLPFNLNIDFNSVGNFDETLNMTFKEHAQAARRLYVALKPETQKSSEVQALVAKSDEMMKQLGEIESALKQDMQSGKLNQGKIDDYRKKLQGIKAQYANQPELQQKVDALLGTLNELQTGLSKAEQSRSQSVSQLKQTSEALNKAQGNLGKLQGQVKALGQKLDQADQKLSQSEARLKAQLEKLSKLRGDVAGFSDKAAAVIDELKPLLASGKLRSKLPEIDKLMSQLQQADSELGGLSSEQEILRAELKTLRDGIASERGTLTEAAKDFNQARGELGTQRKALEKQLTAYDKQIGTLESAHAKAREQFAALTDLPAGEREKLQGALDEARKQIDGHQASLEQMQQTLSETVVPAATAIEQAAETVNQAVSDVEQSFAAVTRKAEATAVMVDAASDATDSTRKALDDLKSQVKGFTDEMRKSLPKLGLNELLDARAKILAQKQELLNGNDPEQLKAELSELDGLLEQVKELEQAIATSSGVQNSLSSSLDELKDQRSSMESELGHAREAVTQAGEEVKQAQNSIQATQTRLKSLDGSLAEYETKLKGWSEALAQLDADNSKSKDAFNKAFASGEKQPPKPSQLSQAQLQQFETERNKMLAGFETVEAKRAAIEKELAGLKRKLGDIKGEMSSQRDLLSGYQKTLSEKTISLEAKRGQVENLSRKLQDVNDNNRTKLADSEAMLAKWASKMPENAAVAAAIAEARTKVMQLRAILASSEQTVRDSGDQLAGLIALERKAKSVQQGLGEGISSIDATSKDLVKTEASVAGVSQKFDTLNQQKAALQAKADALFERIGKGGISAAQIQEELKQIFAGVQDPATLKKLEGSGAALFKVYQMLEQGEQIHASSQGLLAEVAKLKAAYGPELAAMRTLMRQLKAETAQMEKDVQETQNGLLQVQRDLLAQRRQLGITNPAYTRTLERYAQLLQSGKPLSKADAAELQSLEQSLTGMEAQLAQASHFLSERITSMNMLKSKVNARIEELNQKTASLMGLRSQLLEVRGKLGESREALSQHHQNLKGQREELVKQLAALDALAASGGISKVSDITAARQKLLDAIAAVDKQLGDIAKDIDATGTAVKDIDSAIKELDACIQEASNLKQQLEMIQGKLAELLAQVDLLKLDLSQLVKAVSELRLKIQEVETQAKLELEGEPTAAEGPAPKQAPADANMDESLRQTSQQRTDLGRQKLSQRLSDQFSSFWTQRQRQDEAKRESDHQTRRQAFVKDLEQRILLSRQYQSELEAQIAGQQQLEAINEELVQQALLGDKPVSSFNVV